MYKNPRDLLEGNLMKRLIATLLFTLLFLSACGTDPLPPETRPAQQKTGNIPTEEIQSTSFEPTPMSTSAITGEQGTSISTLSQTGPWLVFTTDDGVYAVNRDGSGLSKIFKRGDSQVYRNRILGSDGAKLVGFLDVTTFLQPTLYLVNFPDGNIIFELPLVSEEYAPAVDDLPGDPAMEAVRAILEESWLAFSPDGKSIAFMAAIDGPTSDLYVLSLDTLQVTRLTDGPSQGYQPVWSPDSKYIVHTGVRTFGTGAGYDMEGIWAARADNSGIVPLYDISGSYDEEIIGWVDKETFIVHSWSPSLGRNNLRLVNIETMKIKTLWSDCFYAIALDPDSKALMLSVMTDACLSESGSGLYMVPVDGSSPVRILGEDIPQLIWSDDAKLFLASSEYGILAIDTSGQYITLDKPSGTNTFPAIAPGTKDLAWSGNHILIGSMLGSIDNPPQIIYNDIAVYAIWDPEGEYVLFCSQEGLYHAQKPDYDPVFITDKINRISRDYLWLMPK